MKTGSNNGVSNIEILLKDNHLTDVLSFDAGLPTLLG
jgi:hypothetical protein